MARGNGTTAAAPPSRKARPVNENRTSETHPIQVYWTTNTSHAQPGALGLTFAPGKRGAGLLTGANWQRDLGADLDRLSEHHEMDVLVSLMEDFEYELLGIPTLFTEALTRGISVLRLPIVDTKTPAPDDFERVVALVQKIRNSLAAGHNVVIHCRGGRGRSGTIAALVLTSYGHTADKAIELVRQAQPDAVENREQHAYVADHAAPLAAALSGVGLHQST